MTEVAVGLVVGLGASVAAREVIAFLGSVDVVEAIHEIEDRAPDQRAIG
jgi:hypothetical protein